MRYIVKAEVTVDVEIEIEADSEADAERKFGNGISMSASISGDKTAVTRDENISELNQVTVELPG